MNASSWRKAVDLVAQGTQANQQVQAAAMAESNQLESLPLSTLSADDSGPPQVTYGSEQPLTTSTPRAISTSIPETQTTETSPDNTRYEQLFISHFSSRWLIKHTCSR